MRIKFNQIALVAMSAVALFMAWQLQQGIYENKGRLHVEPDPSSPGTVVFSWNSKIDVPMEQRFKEAFDTWKNRSSRIVIDLHSPGGSLREGRKIIELIQRMKRTHQVDTVVAAYHSCLSMCVPIFLQGERRIAAANSNWMFHEPRSVDFLTGEEVKVPESERKEAARSFFERYFVQSEMDPSWRRQLERDWKGRDVWRTGKQLVDEKSNIIHTLI
jgi:ATP-dependent protease ClpP protease subunit